MRRRLVISLVFACVVAPAVMAVGGADANAERDSLRAIADAMEMISRKPKVALARFESIYAAKPTSPIIRKPLLLYRARAAVAARKYSIAAASLGELRSLPLGKGWSRSASIELARAYLAMGQWDKARRVADEMGKRYGESRRDELVRDMAFGALANRDAPLPRDLIETVAVYYPLTSAARPAFRALNGKACADAERAGITRESLSRMVRHADVDQGLKALILWGLDGTAGNTRPDVGIADLTDRYDILKRARLLPEAVEFVRDVIKRNADESLEVEAAARYLLAKLLADQGLFAESVNAYVRFVADFPNHPMASAAKLDLYLGLGRLGHWDAAARGFGELASSDPSDGTRWYHFWATFRSGQWESALALMDRRGYLIDRGDRGSVGLAYWRGRVLEKLGRHAEADAVYRRVLDTGGDSFYSVILASRRPDLAASVGTSMELAEGPGNFSISGETDGDESRDLSLSTKSPTSSQDAAIINARRYLENGLIDSARVELLEIQWNRVGSEAAFMEAERIARRCRQFHIARRFSWFRYSPLRVLPTAWNELADHQRRRSDVWKAYYPLAYWERVVPASREFGMNPYMILSFMRVESFYDRDALSPVGARGLMQLMPATAARISSEIGDRSFDIGALFGPRANIRLGSAYLAKLMSHYQNNVFLAAAAYNGGPFNVTKWIAGCGSCEMDEFVENITFRETRRYVKEVSRSWNNYARIYGDNLPFAKLPKIALVEPQGQDPF